MDTTKGQVAYDASNAIVLTAQSKAALASANDLKIDSATMYELAGEELQGIKRLQKAVEENRTSITGPLNTALKAVNDLFRNPAQFLSDAEASVKRSMVTWNQAQAQLAAEAQRKADELARAERERLAQIEHEKNEQARIAAAASQEAHDKAQKALAQGDTEGFAAAAREAQVQADKAQEAQAEAQSAATTAEIVTFAPSISGPSKVTGISGRVTYKAEVISLIELVKAVAEGKAPIEAICANDKFLGAQAKAFKKTGPLYPGVNAVAEHGIAARAA